MAPHGRDEGRGVRVQRVAVRHAGDVVRDGALGALALRDAPVLARQDLGMLLEVLEERPEDALRFAVLGLCRTGEVDVLEHVLATRVRRLEDIVAHRYLALPVPGDNATVHPRAQAPGSLPAEPPPRARGN